MSRRCIRRPFVLSLVLLWMNLSLSAHSQEGIPPNIGTGIYPPGFLEARDLTSVAKLRIEALTDGVATLQAMYTGGREGIARLLDAQLELAVTQWESTEDDKEKLQFLEQGMIATLISWQQASERLKVGIGQKNDETLARAAVFRLRHLWLKEKARQGAAKLGDTDRKDPHDSK